MTEIFEALGLRPELGRVAQERGYGEPTSLQRAAIPVLRRGGNAVLHASAGAGTLAAYGLALLDRLAGRGEGEEARVRALVLVPTEEDATLCAVSLGRFGRAVGVRVAALGAGWAPLAAEVVVAAPAAAAAAVESSRLKLEGIEALVLDGASAIFSLGGEEAVEMVTGLIPREAQRVVVSAELTQAVEGYAERHVRRALTIPPVPVEEPEVAEAPLPRPVDYAVIPEAGKLEAVAWLLSTQAAGRAAVVYCRSERRAGDVADALMLRGFGGGVAGELADGVLVTAAASVEAPGGALIVSYDVPFDAETLRARHEEGGTVLVTPREMAHLRLIAGRAHVAPRGRTLGGKRGESELAAYRERLRRAVGEEDLTAQLLVLAPLFEEFAAAEVAAAASALLRQRVVAAPREAAAPAAPARGAAAPVPAPAPAYVRLFVGVGERDGVSARDLVGAITGEAQVQGGQIGRIEVRDTFSIVEVASEIAGRVIQALNGTTLKGRSVRVDYDRRGSAAAPRGGGERPRRRIVPREDRR